jgi:two-component system sensor histidine kinase YesM
MTGIRSSFKWSIYQLFVVSIVMPTLLFSLFLSWYYNNKSIAFYQQNIANMLFSTSKSMEVHFNELERISFTPYLYKDILSAMVLIKNGFLDSDGEKPSYLQINRLEDNYNMVFTKLLHSSAQQISRISFYPVPGRTHNAYIIGRNAAGIRTVYSPGFESEYWYQAARGKNGDIFYTFLEAGFPSGSENPDYISAIRVIRDLDSKKDIGVLKIDVSPLNIKSVLKKVETTPHSYLVLVDERDRIIHASRPIDEALLQQAIKSDATVKQNSDVYYVSSQQIPQTGWRLLYISSRGDIVLSYAGNYLLIFGVTLFALTTAFFIYNNQSSRMVSSVNEIISTIRRLQKGDLTSKCRVNGKNEFSLIAEALNEMGQKLSHHIAMEYKALSDQRNAEYLALQFQINPHFLYNTLNGFIALNRMGEQSLLEQSILQLTHLFRYTSNSSNLSTVGEEFDFICRYLELQKLRYEDQFNYKIDLAGETKAIVVPKLIVQPLVENSIVHGIPPEGGPILICIASRLIENESGEKCLELKISDDGVGFEKERVIAAPHIGLKNIAERIQYFNGKSRLDIESQPGRGTACTIIIPQDSGINNHQENCTC